MISISYRHLIIGMILFFASLSSGFAEESISSIQQYQLRLPGKNNNSGIELISCAVLTNISVNGFKASELSGLAWDKDENILYALSDNGYLLHLRPVIKNSRLIDVLLLNGYALHDDKGIRLKWKLADSEGLAIQQGHNNIHGDSTLLVSFERRPRIIRYTPEGDFIEKINLPARLQDMSNYQNENKSLEAVAIHDELGIIIGTEYPLKGDIKDNMNIYSITGEHWSFPSRGIVNSGLVGMSFLMDRSLLILERNYTGLIPEFNIALHLVSFDGDNITDKIIAEFSPDDNLFDDNFEGITHHENNYFFMISDDNNHPFKRTKLVYFKIFD